MKKLLITWTRLKNKFWIVFAFSSIRFIDFCKFLQLNSVILKKSLRPNSTRFHHFTTFVQLNSIQSGHLKKNFISTQFGSWIDLNCVAQLWARFNRNWTVEFNGRFYEPQFFSDFLLNTQDPRHNSIRSNYGFYYPFVGNWGLVRSLYDWRTHNFILI